MYDAGVALNGLSCFLTPDLARDLANDIMTLVSGLQGWQRDSVTDCCLGAAAHNTSCIPDDINKAISEEKVGAHHVQGVPQVSRSATTCIPAFEGETGGSWSRYHVDSGFLLRTVIFAASISESVGQTSLQHFLGCTAGINWQGWQDFYAKDHRFLVKRCTFRAGVQSAAVNVICELARKNPKNYLSLAPLFFKLMTSSTNNWVLIKIIKLASCVVLSCCISPSRWLGAIVIVVFCVFPKQKRTVGFPGRQVVWPVCWNDGCCEHNACCKELLFRRFVKAMSIPTGHTNQILRVRCVLLSVESLACFCSSEPWHPWNQGWERSS